MTTIAPETSRPAVGDLADFVHGLAFHRAAAAELRARLDAKRQQFELEHAALIADCRAQDKRVADAEDQLRDAVLVHYDATQEKKPTPGVEVKLRHVIEFDPLAAFALAKEKGVALHVELDRKAFEAIAPALSVEDQQRVKLAISDRPMATIARDLSSVLKPAA